MKLFRFLTHSVTSDVAFEAFGKTPEELFESAAIALFSVMCDVKNVEPKTERKVITTGETLEDLLFTFLNELIFLKDRDSMLFSIFDITIHSNDLPAGRQGTYHCSGKVVGEAIDPKRHKLGVDVKAVTKHNFSVVKDSDMYKATVVLDI